MKSISFISLSIQYKLLLGLLALVGVVFVLLSTNRFGAGTSPDSVIYVSTAQNLIKGAGFTMYDGAPLVTWPPLYPALLALVGVILGKGPLIIANIVNALIFGIIVYLSGLIAFKHLSSLPVLALLGTLAILFSIPLFTVTTMAWSEPIFILFILLSVFFVDSYLTKRDITSLILLSFSVAFSCLARYVGVTLLIWGVLIILIFLRKDLKNKIAHLFLFVLISALPLGIWAIRNYVISGTLFGSRTQYLGFTWLQIFGDAFHNLVPWYIPGIIADHRPTLIFFSAAVAFFIGLTFREIWPSLKSTLRQIYQTDFVTIACGLFVIIYVVFSIISAKLAGSDSNSRAFSPIYVPLTLFLLFLTSGLIEPFRNRFPMKTINFILITVVSIWLIYPVYTIVTSTINYSQTGQGYSSKAWIESKTVQYLIQHPTLESDCKDYTNDVYAAYSLAHLVIKTSPTWTIFDSSKAAITSLSGSWPEEDKACLVWFHQSVGMQLLTFSEIQSVANLDLLVKLDDGEIYSITRK